MLSGLSHLNLEGDAGGEGVAALFVGVLTTHVTGSGSGLAGESSTMTWLVSAESPLLTKFGGRGLGVVPVWLPL